MYLPSFSAAFIIEDVTDESQYGLDDPVCTINLSTADTDYEIRLGDYSTMDAQRYVSLGDGNVYLVEDDPLDDFDVTLRDLIDNDETPDFGQVDGIQFDGEDSYQVIYQANRGQHLHLLQRGRVLHASRTRTICRWTPPWWRATSSTITSLALTDYVTYNAAEDGPGRRTA